MRASGDHPSVRHAGPAPTAENVQCCGCFMRTVCPDPRTTLQNWFLGQVHAHAQNLPPLLAHLGAFSGPCAPSAGARGKSK